MEESSNLNSFTVYKESLYYACILLLPSMEHYLNEEGRFYGRVKSYIDSMKLAKSLSDKKITELDKDIYGKILTLIRIQIKKDFMRLGNRKMSCADRIIIITRWILKIIDYIPDQGCDYKFSKETQTFERVLEHLYDNIKNHSKKDTFHNLTKLIERGINNGEISDFRLLNIDLINSGLKNRESDPRKKKKLVIEHEKVILKETKKLLKEIDLD